jgi:hypothetical protein
MDCTLTWTPEEGFVMDAAASSPEVEVSLKGVSVPADGTAELGQGVALHRLDVLFKGEAVVDGAMGQIQDASVRYEGEHLVLDVRVEEVESGEVLVEQFRAKCVMPEGVPASGGPRPVSIDEDELDWEDEETLEQMVMSPPAPKSTSELEEEEDPAPQKGEGVDAEPSGASDVTVSQEEEGQAPASGMNRLLRALLNVGDEDEEEEKGPDDQTMGLKEQGLGFLRILLAQDALEIEEGHEVGEIAEGVGLILSKDTSSEVLAETLSNWLLEQPAVGDLFVGDEDLEAMLDQW